jgi:hypothetical protein
MLTRRRRGSTGQAWIMISKFPAWMYCAPFRPGPSPVLGLTGIGSDSKYPVGSAAEIHHEDLALGWRDSQHKLVWALLRRLLFSRRPGSRSTFQGCLKSSQLPIKDFAPSRMTFPSADLSHDQIDRSQKEPNQANRSDESPSSSRFGPGTIVILWPCEVARDQYELSTFEKSHLHAHATIQTMESTLCSRNIPRLICINSQGLSPLGIQSHFTPQWSGTLLSGGSHMSSWSGMEEKPGFSMTLWSWTNHVKRSMNLSFLQISFTYQSLSSQHLGFMWLVMFRSNSICSLFWETKAMPNVKTIWYATIVQRYPEYGFLKRDIVWFECESDWSKYLRFSSSSDAWINNHNYDNQMNEQMEMSSYELFFWIMIVSSLRFAERWVLEQWNH